ncbi:MAG: deoxyribodipyrimidine photo-lyase [Lautropia sp.]
MAPLRSALVWFRRDLRIHDNATLALALESVRRVHCVFVYDREILDELPSRADRRVEFIVGCVDALRAALAASGGHLITLHAHASRAIPSLAGQLDVDAVFCGRDDEPAAIRRDHAVGEALQAQGRRLLYAKDNVVFERDEVLTGAGRPFSVFTPYKRAWLARLTREDVAERRVVAGGANGVLAPAQPTATQYPADAGADRAHTLASLGFERTNLGQLAIEPGEAGAKACLDAFADRIREYDEQRDYPAARGTSLLSVHLRFGTVSVREACRFAIAHGALRDPGFGAATWLSELIWRDFYAQILYHHPRVVHHAFKPEYEAVAWVRDDARFAAWCEARTGYPIVDAAMCQINRTGFMHNRLRMIVASFLTKDLGIDWREGERYFAAHLNDYDQSANNGGWQWAASTGCDAQPYFRIFNPVTQSRRFDPRGDFIRRYLPALAALDDDAVHAPWLASPVSLAAAGVVLGRDYPAPIVDHARARVETLARFKAAVATARD